MGNNIIPNHFTEMDGVGYKKREKVLTFHRTMVIFIGGHIVTEVKKILSVPVRNSVLYFNNIPVDTSLLSLLSSH